MLGGSNSSDYSAGKAGRENPASSANNWVKPESCVLIVTASSGSNMWSPILWCSSQAEWSVLENHPEAVGSCQVYSHFFLNLPSEERRREKRHINGTNFFPPTEAPIYKQSYRQYYCLPKLSHSLSTVFTEYIVRKGEGTYLLVLCELPCP